MKIVDKCRVLLANAARDAVMRYTRPKVAFKGTTDPSRVRVCKYYRNPERHVFIVDLTDYALSQFLVDVGNDLVIINLPLTRRRCLVRCAECFLAGIFFGFAGVLTFLLVGDSVALW